MSNLELVKKLHEEYKKTSWWNVIGLCKIIRWISNNRIVKYDDEYILKALIRVHYMNTYKKHVSFGDHWWTIIPIIGKYKRLKFLRSLIKKLENESVSSN